MSFEFRGRPWQEGRLKKISSQPLLCVSTDAIETAIWQRLRGLFILVVTPFCYQWLTSGQGGVKVVRVGGISRFETAAESVPAG